MNEKEELARDLRKMGDVAMGLSRTAHILGFSRDRFVKLMTEAAKEVAAHNAASLPYQTQCPWCKVAVTFAVVDGKREVKWG
jgi:hypothetical protein